MNTLECHLKIAEEFGLVINFDAWHKQNIYKVTASGLNIRKAPSLTSSVVGTLAYGDSVQILDVVDDWAKIGDDKWVSIKYLAEVK